MNNTELSSAARPNPLTSAVFRRFGVLGCSCDVDRGHAASLLRAVGNSPSLHSTEPELGQGHGESGRSRICSTAQGLKAKGVAVTAVTSSGQATQTQSITSSGFARIVGVDDGSRPA